MTAENNQQENQDGQTPENPETEESKDSATDAAQPDTVAENTAVEIAELKDRVLRAMAETENVRRRAERDKQDASQYAVTSFARELLGVSDNLRRAIEHAPAAGEQSEEVKTLLDGIQLTENELLRVFDKHGIKKVEPAAGDKFDPNLHQAMFEIPTNEHPHGSVVQVMQAGYVLHGRLLRPAMVGVAKSAPTEKVDQTA